MRQGLAVEHRPDKCLIYGIDDTFDLRMPALVGHTQVGHIAALRPGFADPVSAFYVGDKIQKPAGRYKIMNEVAARSEPRGGIWRNITNPLGGDEASICAAREARALMSKQQAANSRVNTVRADQQVG